MNYLIKFMADVGISLHNLAPWPPSQDPELLNKWATREARRIFNLLSETTWTGGSGIKNLQQYKDWLDSPGPHILARLGPYNSTQVKVMRDHLANPPQESRRKPVFMPN